jgi:hypothetical protein
VYVLFQIGTDASVYLSATNSVKHLSAVALMAWIPPNAPPNLLARVSAEQWNAWADGAPLDIASQRHSQQQTAYAFRLNTTFSSPSESIEYKKGMQGQFLGLTEKGMAKIFIRGVTEGDGFKNRHVPLKYLDKGPLWQDDVNKWRLDVKLPGHIVFDKGDWTSSPLTDTTVLGKTVNLLISAFLHSPAPGDAEKITDYIRRCSVPGLTMIIIKGIKDAGLYNVLSDADKEFTLVDLITAARIRVVDRSPSDRAGVYARFHKSSQNVEHWKPHSRYAYVGKSTDFGLGFESHLHSSSKYGDLSRNSESLDMIALCVLSATANPGMFYLTEQLFVCLWQTYKPDLTSPTTTDSSLLVSSKLANYYTNISDEVFRMTGWHGFIGRGLASSGIEYGANCSSPLHEYGVLEHKQLLIRSDENIRDNKTGSFIPMAIYRCAEQVSIPAGSKRVNVFKYCVYKNGEREEVISFRARYGKKGDVHLPPPGSVVNFVIEVRKDGTTHPHAWARLPAIGPFTNWDQANSFAVRIEWDFPVSSGKWQFAYVQSNTNKERTGPQLPGSLKNYAKAIAFLQWLTNDRPNHNYAWIPKTHGAALVVQTEYDFMNQTIRFQDAKNDIVMLSCGRRSNDDIIAQMLRPEYGLTRVAGKNRGSSCDTCRLLPFSTKAKTFPDRECVPVKLFADLCTNCALLGLPCCTFTDGVYDKHVPHTPDTRLATDKAAAALVGMPLAVIPQESQSFTQQLRTIESDNQNDDDGSDCGDDDLGESDDSGESDDDDFE